MLLTENDRGSWLVETLTGLYVVDLGMRRLVRTTKTAAPFIQVDGGGVVMRRDFDIDGQWLELIDLHCEVGERMTATILISGRPQPLRSSRVRQIERAQ